MITMTFNTAKGAKPLYVQLYDHIRIEILEKRIPAGEKLPSKARLASHLGVSIKTVENAYFQLCLEGYVQSKEKVGFFVNKIEGFRTKKGPSAPLYTSKYKPSEYRLDVKGNGTPKDLFPFSLWARLGREILSEHDDALLETVPFNGIPEIRIAIARYLSEFRGMRVSPDQIIIGSGTEYLYQRITHLLGPRCVIGMDDPGYSHIKKILSNDGVSYRCIPMDESGIRPDMLALTDCTAVHVTPQHHFPLGITMPVQRRVQLLQWINAAHDRYLIEDDYNSEFIYQGNPVPTMYSLDIRGKVIYMNTFSKTIAPGLRIAYMVLPEKLMDKYLETMSFYSCTVCSALQHQLAKFINEGHLERHIHRVRQFNLSQRKMVLEEITASKIASKLQVESFSSGTHFLVNLATSKTDEEIREALLKEGVLTSFASEYCEAPNSKLNHKMILNYSRITKSELQWLLSLLEDMM